MDKAAFRPIVLTRKSGPVNGRYQAIGVTCLHMSELPPFRPADRNNLISFAIFLWQLRRLPALYRRVKTQVRAHNIQLIHVNHESFALIGLLLSRLFGLPWIAHIRTTLTPTWFARRLSRVIAKNAVQVICIVEPVKRHFCALAGVGAECRKISVIHNIVPPIAFASPATEFESPPDRFRVLSLTNFSPNRGVDRIVDVAEELRGRGDGRFAFYLCGRPANANPITGRIDPYFESIRQKVRSLSLEDTVFFPGHVSEPERALGACDALIKLTRQANPWGRDAIEALAAGLPVITLGTFQEVIENEINGYIADEYRSKEIASYLQRLADDPTLRQRIAVANRAKAERLFSPAKCARATEAVYRLVLSTRIDAANAKKPCAA